METSNSLEKARKVAANAKLADERNKLLDRIADFLSERRESDGGWAKITEQDIEDLHGIFFDIINLKCEEDPDGDIPIDYKIIDRTKEEPTSDRSHTTE